ncbi:MAG: DUF4149 domain-containing protein [Burkholderiales bacterium]
MSYFFDGLHWIAVTLWVGALWAVGYIAAPVLFYFLDDRALAGTLAARMYSLVAQVGIGCGAYLLLFRLVRQGAYSIRQGFFWITLLMLLFTLVGYFGVQPIMENLKQPSLVKEIADGAFKDRFATWYGMANVLYLIESALGLALVLLQPRAAP